MEHFFNIELLQLFVAGWACLHAYDAAKEAGKHHYLSIAVHRLQSTISPSRFFDWKLNGRLALLV